LTDLAHAWGREEGFHTTLANNVCERRGEIERKRRSARTEEEKEAHRQKKRKMNECKSQP